jgi:predicted aminopeptidase
VKQRPLVRRRLGLIGWILLGILGGSALLIAVTPMGRYLARAGWEESKILSRRKSITALVNDSSTPAATRAKLQLVLEARKFAVDSLGLVAKDAFTKFTQLDGDTLVLVLSGTRKDALVAHTWWFPIVGRVPYKGFFDVEAAKRAEIALASEGYDTYLRPSPAFSTLGWFNDPLLSTTLSEDSLFIVQTVIHELTHNRIYLKGQAVFNESFAEFVGNRGTVEFYRSRGDSAGAARAEARWKDEILLGTAWQRGFREIDSVFKSLPYGGDGSGKAAGDSAIRVQRLAKRDTVYSRLRKYLTDTIAPSLKTIAPSYAERVRLDNAALLARRIYTTNLGAFEEAWERDGRSVRKTLDRIAAAAPGAVDAYTIVRP